MNSPRVLDAIEPIVRWVATGCLIVAVFLYLWVRR